MELHVQITQDNMSPRLNDMEYTASTVPCIHPSTAAGGQALLMQLFVPALGT